LRPLIEVIFEVRPAVAVGIVPGVERLWSGAMDDLPGEPRKVPMSRSSSVAYCSDR
jgi:hypothetical protein